MKKTILPDSDKLVEENKPERTLAQRSSDKQFKAMRKKQKGYMIEQNLDALLAIQEDGDIIEEQLQDIDLKYRCTCTGGTDPCDNVLYY